MLLYTQFRVFDKNFLWNYLVAFDLNNGPVTGKGPWFMNSWASIYCKYIISRATHSHFLAWRSTIPYSESQIVRKFWSFCFFSNNSQPENRSLCISWTPDTHDKGRSFRKSVSKKSLMYLQRRLIHQLISWKRWNFNLNKKKFLVNESWQFPP